ncbi:UNVERIFIED_CONTAM: hypothetical protein Sradi_0817700 [Sesamum radiatum]|uniref:Reverse transcriptase domain-containing protein n=1 Tax=Sesamum radiatum TaxID=300843 RepID=A0AAW2VRQ1_SESRA
MIRAELSLRGFAPPVSTFSNRTKLVMSMVRKLEERIRGLQGQSITSERRAKLGFLKDELEKWVVSKEGIQQIILNYFRSMFESTHPTKEAMEEVVSCIKPRVTTAMNEALAQPFTSEEVTIALNQMHPLKSPGPDGMSPIFYQQYWSIVGPESAFVPGRLIMDNVLLAYELNHFLKNKTWGRRGHTSIKLDVSKAYDRVEWVFLERVLGRLGFNEGFVRLVMKYVTTVSFSFLLNGEQFGILRPEQGLRQGDPLSPYFFLFCAEAFSGLIRKAESEGTIEGVAVSRKAPSVSHLLFADDMLIFCQATKESPFKLAACVNIF